MLFFVLNFILGFGFLTFESEDSVDQVCSEHFVQIGGKKVTSITHFSITQQRLTRKHENC